jgi:hypothetical protein
MDLPAQSGFLVTSSSFPHPQDILLPVVLGSTVVFVLLGPVGVRWAIGRAWEVRR